ncbi:MAG: aminotransferase class I/II-fold pyridoxal phosphate-dependent enzyme [Candidatus Saccharimonadales bacterium]
MLAKRLKHFDSSLIRQAFDRADDIPGSIDLSIGFPEDATPDYIKAAGIRAIEENFTRYTPSNGISELRTAVAEKLRRENNIQVSPDEVSITPGLTTAIMLTYLALLNPGDEVLLPDPYFPPYRDLVKLVGANPVIVNTYPSFQLTAKMLEPLITPRTKLMIINSPNNPSGAVYPERELRKIAALAKRHNIYVVSDEIYEHFSYDTKHFSIGSIYPKTITLNGFSKAYAMTGWRIGYIAAPLEIINAINQLQQYIVFSSSSIAQKAAVAALRKSPSKLTKKYKAKRDLVIKYLDPHFEIYGTQGAFYAYIRLPEGIDDLTFAEAAARNGVIVIPSRAFSAKTDHIRVAFAIKHADLVSGLKRIRKTMGELQEEKANLEELAI